MEKVFFKEGFKRVFKSDHVGVVRTSYTFKAEVKVPFIGQNFD